MKYCAFLLLPVLSVAQQSESSTALRDINGRLIEGSRISASKGAGALEKRETVQSVNGRRIPLESTEEKVISDSGGVRIIERIYKRFDQNGQVASTEKTKLEERKNPDGSLNTSAVVTRSNINGGFDLYERRNTISSKSGDTTTSNTSVERASINGSFEPTERIEEVRQEAKDGSGSIRSITQRKDTNGRFYEWQRENTEKVVQNGTLVENSAVYGAVDNSGLQLLRQTVSRTNKEPNGAESKQIEIYEVHQPGRAKTSEHPVLREVHVIERTPVPGGAAETVSVKRPLPSEPSRLGAAQIISSTVCSGECK